MKRILLALLVVLLAPAVQASVDAQLKVDDADSFMFALIRSENPWLDPNKIGDRNLFYKAHGLLQIRKPYLEDVNRIVGYKTMIKMWGKPRLTMADMKNTHKAIWTSKVYMVYYGKEYEQETGRSVNEQIYARIHNGGPIGYQKWITREYWAKVRSYMISYIARSDDADTINKRET